MAIRIWMKLPIPALASGVGIPPAVPAFPGFYDYSSFVFLPDSVSGGGQSVVGAGGGQSTQAASLIKTWELNVPQKVQFFVGGDLSALNTFAPPVTGTEVWIDTATFPKFFTGFITNEPEVVVIGSTTDAAGNEIALYGYVCQCQSSEILLDMNRIGFMPPFTNMTIGDIIGTLGDRIVPGRFDWDQIRGFGSVIPVYATTPDQRFSQVVSDLTANQAIKHWYVRYKAFMSRYDESNPAVEPTVDETSTFYNPYDLVIKPIPSAVVNDVTGIGDTEAQIYCSEYTLGDGITTNFPLKFPMYGTLGKPIMADDFSGTAFDPAIWAPFRAQPPSSYDPTGAFIFDSGRLNVVGGLGITAGTRLVGAQGVEIKGDLNINVGEFQFIDQTDAIVGGLFLGNNFVEPECVFGWRILGGGSVATIVDYPVGVRNGVNKVFTLKYDPIGNLINLFIIPYPVQINGVWQTPAPIPQTLGTDYTIVGRVITFTVAPPGTALTGFGTNISAKYNYAGTATGRIIESPQGSANGSNTDFFLSHVPTGPVQIIVNGVSKVQGTNADYIVQGNDVIFFTPPPAGASVQAQYSYVIGAGAGISIQPIVNGQLVGDKFFTKDGMTYALHIHLNTPTFKTTLPPWYSSGSAFGGGSKNAPVTCAFLLEEYSQLAIKDPLKFQSYSGVVTGIPAFLTIGELVVASGNFVVNFFSITTPIQGTLIDYLPSDRSPSYKRLGFVGDSSAEATIISGQESETLSFFLQTRPAAGQRNVLYYRSAGPAIARVVDGKSIVQEQQRYGDSGVRSAFLTNINPLPATSEQLEWALQAYLADNTRQQFEGTWNIMVPPEPITTEPMPGRFINVRCRTRTPEIGDFSELVKVVTTTVLAETETDAQGNNTLVQGSTTIPQITDFGEGPPDIVQRVFVQYMDGSAHATMDLNMTNVASKNILLCCCRWAPTAGAVPTIRSTTGDIFTPIYQEANKAFFACTSAVGGSPTVTVQYNAGGSPINCEAYIVEIENAAGGLTISNDHANSGTATGSNGPFSFAALMTASPIQWGSILAVATSGSGEMLGVAMILTDNGFFVPQPNSPVDGWADAFVSSTRLYTVVLTQTNLGPQTYLGGTPATFIVGAAGEAYEVSMDYGLVVTRQMEKVLEKFVPQDPPGVATLRQIPQIPQIDTTLVGTKFLQDITRLTLVGRDSANYYFDINMEIPPNMQVEARYTNESWGQISGSNLIGRFTTRTFAVSRRRRDTIVFVKLVSTVLTPV